MPMDLGNGARRPPSPEQALEEFINKLRGRFPGGCGFLIAIVGLLMWLATGYYQVNPSEAGVVLRFGKAVYTTEPGPHFHIPWPVETVITVPIMAVLKEEVGFRTISVGPPARYRNVVEEARMLTSDGNIVDLDFIIQYRIKDPIAYLFKIRNPTETLRDCAESAMREVVGRSTINSALTEGRLDIQVRAQELLQQMLDGYGSGLQVTTVKLQDVKPPEPVQDAFKDVINAEQDKERLINEAQGFANDILPKARGVAAESLNEAEAYAESVVKKALGEAGRFDLLYDAYVTAPDVTRKRLYLETMEQILPGIDKIIISDSISQKILPYLPLDRKASIGKGGDSK